jgi:tetratricopeptide (TPR) repeat protein
MTELDAHEPDLRDYEPRAPGSEASYVLLDRAMLAAKRRRAEAVGMIERAVESFVARGDAQGEARARAKAAKVFRERGNLARAEQEAQRALAWFADHPERAFEADAALELGQVLEARGDLDGAVAAYATQLAAYGEPRSGEPEVDARMRAYFADCMANALAKRGDLEEAIGYRRQALPVFDEQQLGHDAVIGWTNLALDLIRLGRVDEAGRALAVAER